jgi:hypothetical protein
VKAYGYARGSSSKRAANSTGHSPRFGREQEGCGEPMDEARAEQEEGIDEGLKHRPPPGAAAEARLSQEQQAKLPELLRRGAPALMALGERCGPARQWPR